MPYSPPSSVFTAVDVPLFRRPKPGDHSASVSAHRTRQTRTPSAGILNVSSERGPGAHKHLRGLPRCTKPSPPPVVPNSTTPTPNASTPRSMAAFGPSIVSRNTPRGSPLGENGPDSTVQRPSASTASDDPVNLSTLISFVNACLDPVNETPREELRPSSTRTAGMLFTPPRSRRTSRQVCTESVESPITPALRQDPSLEIHWRSTVHGVHTPKSTTPAPAVYKPRVGPGPPSRRPPPPPPPSTQMSSKSPSPSGGSTKPPSPAVGTGLPSRASLYTPRSSARSSKVVPPKKTVKSIEPSIIPDLRRGRRLAVHSPIMDPGAHTPKSTTPTSAIHKHPVDSRSPSTGPPLSPPSAQTASKSSSPPGGPNKPPSSAVGAKFPPRTSLPPSSSVLLAIPREEHPLEATPRVAHCSLLQEPEAIPAKICTGASPVVLSDLAEKSTSTSAPLASQYAAPPSLCSTLSTRLATSPSQAPLAVSHLRFGTPLDSDLSDSSPGITNCALAARDYKLSIESSSPPAPPPPAVDVQIGRVTPPSPTIAIKPSSEVSTPCSSLPQAPGSLLEAPEEEYPLRRTRPSSHRPLSLGHKAISPRLRFGIVSLKSPSNLVRELSLIPFGPHPLRIGSSQAGYLHVYNNWILAGLRSDDHRLARMGDFNHFLFRRLVEHYLGFSFRTKTTTSAPFQYGSLTIIDLSEYCDELSQYPQPQSLPNTHDCATSAQLESKVSEVTNVLPSIPYRVAYHSAAPVPIPTSPLQNARLVDEGKVGKPDLKRLHGKIYGLWTTRGPAERSRRDSWRRVGQVECKPGSEGSGKGRMHINAKDRRLACGLKNFWRCLGIPTSTHRDFVGSPPLQCHPTLCRLNGPRHSKFNPRLAPPFRPFYKIISSWSQRVKGCSAGSGWGPGGLGDATLNLDFFGFNDFLNNWGSTAGVASWPKQGPGLELLHTTESNNDPPQVYLDTGLATSIPIEPQYHDGGDSATQQPPNNPPPHVPLAVNPQSNSHRPAWNAGFVAGCQWFSAHGSGGSPSQPQDSLIEWNAGFVAGCMLASQMAREPLTAPPPQPNATRPLTQVVLPMSMPAVRNNNQPLQTPASPDNLVTRAIPPVSHDLATQTVDLRLHGQSGPSTSQIVARVDITNATRASPLLTPQESTSQLNNQIPIDSNVGPTRHTHGRKKHRCDTCGKEFSGKYRLDAHTKRAHLGQVEVHTCDFPGCTKSYSNQAGMRKHYKAKHGGNRGE